MTAEDDAFIRTIVDSPGHDLPRLVYADWLDDRDDPRGAYLRAERGWAKLKYTSGFLPPRLNRLTEGLDPVWVARVSRPPIGVCCDHHQFTDHGPPLSTDDIAECERNLGVRFPAEYIAFMLNFNGGKLRLPPTSVSFGGTWRLFTLSEVTRWELRPGDLFDGSQHMSYPPLREPVGSWLSRYVVIGHDPDVIGGIFLCVEGDVAGELRILDMSVEIESGVRIHQDDRPPFARQFARFIARLS